MNVTITASDLAAQRQAVTHAVDTAAYSASNTYSDNQRIADEEKDKLRRMIADYTAQHGAIVKAAIDALRIFAAKPATSHEPPEWQAARDIIAAFDQSTK